MNVREGSTTIHEGETRTLAVVWEGAAATSSVSDEVYQNGSSVGALTGAASTVGVNVMQTRTLTVPAGAGGNTLVWTFTATVDGDVRKASRDYEVLRPGQES